MKTKTILGYYISEPFNACIPDTQHVRVSLNLYKTVDPAETLLSASYYSDNSLPRAQKQVNRMRDLKIKFWLDTMWGDDQVEIRLQGNKPLDVWYACHITDARLGENTSKVISKLSKAFLEASNSCELVKLQEALSNIGAVKVTYDKEGDFAYIVPTIE